MNEGKLTRSQYKQEKLTGASVMQYIFANNLIQFSKETTVAAQFSQMGLVCSGIKHLPLSMSQLMSTMNPSVLGQVYSSQDHLSQVKGLL